MVHGLTYSYGNVHVPCTIQCLPKNSDDYYYYVFAQLCACTFLYKEKKHFHVHYSTCTCTCTVHVEWIFYNLVHKSTVSFLSAAPRPKPFEADKAYFSEVPKLVAIPKQPGKTLGLSIMTREVRTLLRSDRVMFSIQHEACNWC